MHGFYHDGPYPPLCPLEVSLFLMAIGGFALSEEVYRHLLFA
jgi:hypothetical protein